MRLPVRSRQVHWLNHVVEGVEGSRAPWLGLGGYLPQPHRYFYAESLTLTQATTHICMHLAEAAI